MTVYSRSRSLDSPRFETIGYGPWANLSVNCGPLGSMSGFIQKPISDTPLPYDKTLAWIVDRPKSPVAASSSIALLQISPSNASSSYDLAYNRAYVQFVNRVHSERANLALTAIDYEKSALMIAARCSQLLNAFRQVKRGNLGRAAGILSGNSPIRRYAPPKGRWYSPSARKASSGWLELQFGWMPLLSDIYSGCKVLGNPPPSPNVKGFGSSTFQSTKFYDGSTPAQKVEGKIRCSISARIRVTSPNLLLLNELGLVNPAFVLWDAVPFSFVADWFLPIGRYLNSWTDFVGLQLENASHTFLSTGQDFGPWNPGVYPGVSYFRSSSALRMQRVVANPSMRFPTTLQFKPSTWKAVTSAALLVQKCGSSLRF